MFSGGVRVCSTLSQFDRLRISPFFPGEPDSIRSRTIRSLQFCCKRPPINSVSKFTRLRATSTIPRNSLGFGNCSLYFRREKVHQSSRDFTRVRRSSNSTIAVARVFPAPHRLDCRFTIQTTQRTKPGLASNSLSGFCSPKQDDLFLCFSLSHVNRSIKLYSYQLEGVHEKDSRQDQVHDSVVSVAC